MPSKEVDNNVQQLKMGQKWIWTVANFGGHTVCLAPVTLPITYVKNSQIPTLAISLQPLPDTIVNSWHLTTSITLKSISLNVIIVHAFAACTMHGRPFQHNGRMVNTHHHAALASCTLLAASYCTVTCTCCNILLTCTMSTTFTLSPLFFWCPSTFSLIFPDTKYPR